MGLFFKYSLQFTSQSHIGCVVCCPSIHINRVVTELLFHFLKLYSLFRVALSTSRGGGNSGHHNFKGIKKYSFSILKGGHQQHTPICFRQKIPFLSFLIAINQMSFIVICITIPISSCQFLSLSLSRKNLLTRPCPLQYFMPTKLPTRSCLNTDCSNSPAHATVCKLFGKGSHLRAVLKQRMKGLRCDPTEGGWKGRDAVRWNDAGVRWRFLTTPPQPSKFLCWFPWFTFSICFHVLHLPFQTKNQPCEDFFFWTT